MKAFLEKYLFQISIGFVLIIAFVFRFYDYFAIPYTWDELSALERLKFDSFSELINKGVKPDGHPALVQVFLYYWTAIFGTSEWIVKLPFNLMGLTSVYIFYRIGSIWFNKNVGLITACFIATVQLFVFYSSIARPYASGLFLVSMMVFYWSLYFFRGFERKHLLGFIIFAALCAYNHHFTLLFAAIVGLSGLFFIPKKKILEYFISGLSIFILYLPHLGIFLHQFEIGGIGGEGGYLGKPTPKFFKEFFYWLVHYSPVGIVGLLIVFVSSIYFGLKSRMTINGFKKRLVLCLWFSLPIVIGYYYSIEINPVLQFSILIFSTPFIFMLISSGIAEKAKYFSSGLLIVSISLSSFTLISSRQHFSVIFRQIFNTPLELLDDQKIETDEVLFLHSTYVPYQEFYNNKYNRRYLRSYSVLSDIQNIEQLDSIIKLHQTDHILLSGVKDNFVPYIQNYYPNLVKRVDGLLQEHYLFSKTIENKEQLSKVIIEVDFENYDPIWEYDPSRVVYSDGKKVFEFADTLEWGIRYLGNYMSMVQGVGGILDLYVEYEALEEEINPTLILSIEKEGQFMAWRGEQVKGNSYRNGNIIRHYASLDLRAIFNERVLINPLLSILVWNINFDHFRVRQFRLTQRPRNKIKYGTLYPIE